MAGTTLANAYVQIIPSAKGIKGSISNIMNGEAGAAGDSAGKSIAGRIKGAIAAAGIGTAVAALLKSSIAEGSELQQNLGGTEAVFGRFADNIQNKAKESYKNMGLSASDYMATANKMGSLFQGSGVKQEQALKLTESAMQRAADVASVMGVDTTMAMESIAGAAKGNFTMMDNLGVAMNATTLQAYALEKGVNFDWKTASNAEKAELAMKMFMDRTSQYQGNFARESEETLSGAFGAMKAAAQNFLGNLTLGQDVTPALENLITTTVTYMGNLIPAIGNIVTGIPQAIGNVFAEHGDEWLQSGTAMLDKIGEGMKSGIPNFVTAAVNGLSSVAEGIKNNSGKFLDAGINMLKSVADGVAKSLPVIAESAPKIIASLLAAVITNAPKIAKGGMEIIQKLRDGVMKSGPAFLKGVTDVAKGAMEAFKNIDWKSVGKEALDLIVTAVKTFGSMLPPALLAIGKTAINAFKSVDWKGVGKAAIELIKNAAVAAGGLLASGLKTIGNAAKEKFKEIDWKAVGKKAIELIATAVTAAGKMLWSAVKSVAQSAKDKFKEIDWGQLGKDIISGIVNGIAGAAGKLTEKMRSLASDALNAAKKKLKINSPSKVFADEVGRYIPEGMAEGVVYNAQKVTKAVTDMAQESVTQAKANTPAMGEIGKKYAMDIAEGIAANKDLAKKSAEDVSKSMLSAAQIKIKELKALNQISLAEEVAYWKQIAESTTQGTNAYATALTNMSKAQKALAAERKKAAEEEKKTEQEHKKMLDSIGKAQQNYVAKAKDISKNLKQEIKSLKQELQNNIAAVQSQLESGIKNLWDTYNNTVKNTQKNIAGSYSLFDAVSASEEKSGQQLMDNLQSQVISLADYTTELSALRSRIGETDLFQEIVSMGTSALNDVKALNSLSSEQLGEYLNLYQQKQALAYSEAVAQNTKLKMETEQGITEMKQSAAEQISAYESETADLIKAAKKAAKKQMKELNKEFLKALKEAGVTYKTQGKDGGKQLVKGIDEGIKSHTGGLYSTVRNMADEMVKQLKNKLKVKSPSRVMAEVGKFIPAGIAQGIENNLGTVTKAMGLASDTVQNGFSGNTQFGMGFPVGSGSTQSTTVYMTINGAPGQDVEKLADIISQKINQNVWQQRAVFA